MAFDCPHSQFGRPWLTRRLALRSWESAMSERPPLVRQWIVLRTLCARRYGVTVRELAQEMGVSEKTIRRDLDHFREVGFPLDETVGDHGLKRWRLGSEGTIPNLSFTFDEAIALYLGRHLLEPLAGTLFWDGAQRAFKKIRAMLGSNAIKYVEQFGQAFHQTMVGASDYSKKADILDQLMMGIEDHCAVFITYQSLQATEPVTYDIYPYGLSYHRGSLYVVGRAPQHNAIRHWKVDRIEEAEVTQIPFPRPEDFDLHEHFAKSFGVFQGQDDVHVKIWFSPDVRRYVEESNWHASQKLVKQTDGALIAEFHLNDTEEIKRWVMSFGHHAVVMEPELLREQILEELASLVALYGDDGTRENMRTARWQARDDKAPESEEARDSEV